MLRDDSSRDDTVLAVQTEGAAVRPGRVLVSMKTYLGDAVMTAPLLDALEAAGWETTLLTSPLAAKALGRSKVIPFEKCRWPWKVMRQAQELRAMEFDACLLVNRSVRAALLARLAGIPIRVGHPREGRAALLTHRVPYDPSRFEAATVGDLGRPLGVIVTDPTPRLTLTPEEMAEGDRLRQGADLAIQPGARYDEKRLPMEALQTAARTWQSEGRKIVTVGGPEERAETDALIGALDHSVVDLVGHCGVRQTMAVLAGASRAVGADTGVMHLAVAVGCPTVQAFGPTPFQKWGHSYGPHRVLAAPNGCMSALTAGELMSAVNGR
jgi:ADP-heptose:LPS heptosyltransferase